MRFTVHFLGTGHASILPLYFLAQSEAVVRLSVDSRNDERTRALVEDLQQATTDRKLPITAAPMPKDTDIVVIAYGRTTQPGEPRENLFAENLDAICAKLGSASLAQAFVAVVSNPVDAMTEAIRRRFRVPSNRIVGIGGDLDAARIAWALGAETVTVYGEHGESSVFVVDGEVLPPAAQVAPQARQSLARQLQHLGAPTFTSGGCIVNVLNTIFRSAASKPHHLSVYDPGYGTCVTRPCSIGPGPDAVALPLEPPPQAHTAIEALARKNRRLVDEVMPTV